MSKIQGAILIITVLFMISPIYALNDMSIIAAFQGEHHRSAFGYSMVSLDFNHDGIDDLVICSPNYGYVYPGTTDPGHGKLYMYYGTNGFNSNTCPALTYEGSFDGSSGRVVLGVFKIGDVSGDGFDDLCVYVEDHISWNESYEKLLFFYGPPPNLNNPDHVIDLFGSVYQFGRIYSLGDINGDCYEDMGFYYMQSPSYQSRQSIIWGGSFTEQVVSTGELSDSFSSSINGIGDINNDGYDDFTTGFATPSIDPTHNLIRLYYGNAAGNTDNPITFIYCQYGVSRGSKPLGDMNGDGYDDFMGYITDEGMHAWLGGTNINYAVPDFDMDPPWYGGEFQRSLEHGDFNNDGYEDAVGASFGSGFAVWLGKQNVNGTSDLIKNNPGYENYGYSLVTGDFNADGYDDIAIAASHEYDPWPEGNFNGYVWVYAGNAQLADTTVANEDAYAPQVTEQMQMHLSPNPVTKDRRINLSFTGACKDRKMPVLVEIYNLKGQLVHHSEIKEVTSNATSIPAEFSQYPSGVYICRAKVGNQTVSKKFTIIK